jgi:hypothetical protein
LLGAGFLYAQGRSSPKGAGKTRWHRAICQPAEKLRLQRSRKSAPCATHKQGCAKKKAGSCGAQAACKAQKNSNSPHCRIAGLAFAHLSEYLASAGPSAWKPRMPAKIQRSLRIAAFAGGAGFSPKSGTSHLPAFAALCRSCIRAF